MTKQDKLLIFDIVMGAAIIIASLIWTAIDAYPRLHPAPVTTKLPPVYYDGERSASDLQVGEEMGTCAFVVGLDGSLYLTDLKVSSDEHCITVRREKDGYVAIIRQGQRWDAQDLSYLTDLIPVARVEFR
ncbi:MAG: hypothetical protein KGL39_25480 [Patescibacteria group bacterium]|nr:hypothetical protein [Patescibacteria group bacterium]